MGQHEEHKRGLSKGVIDDVVLQAKKAAELACFTLKNPAKRKKIGSTTAEDDIILIGKIIDRLAVGFDVAIETDANPLLLLESMKPRSFTNLFLLERDDLLSHIPEIEKKLPAAADKQAQIQACFAAAKDALEKALLTTLHLPVSTLSYVVSEGYGRS